MLMPTIWGENLFDDFFDDFRRPMPPARRRVPERQFMPTAVMKTDIKETENGFELAIDLPGFRKEDVKAELKDGYLTVNAASKSEEEEKDDNGRYIRRERFYGSCSRSFYVGEDITEEDIKAQFADGILKLNVPKKEPEPKVEEKHFISIEG